MTPEEEKELAELEELERLEAEEAAASPADKAKAAEIGSVVSPAVSVPAQVLSAQPATTDPRGDEAAQSDWVVKGTDAAKQATMVYEPPLRKAKEELLGNPQLISALFPDEQIPPEFIQNMDANSDIYKAYADHKWNDARWAAAESGTTAYRYSKAPWLQGGAAAGLSPLGTLGTKLKGSVNPLIEGANALILGVDDTAAFGAGRAAGEAVDRATGNPTEELNQQRVEEYPGLHTAGRVAGLFTPAGVMGLLGKGASALTRGAGAAAAKAGGGAIAQGAAKLAASVPAAAVGGAAAQAGREGVQAASSLSKTGETGTTLGEAADRSVAAGLDPANLWMGLGGEGAGMIAGGLARGIARSPHYRGNIERVEQLGGEIKLGRGPVGSEGAEAAIKEGRTRDISPQDVIAERIAPKIAEAENAVAQGNFQGAKKLKDEAKISHGEAKKQYFATPEGKAMLAPVETLETNLKHLRSKVAAGPGGGLRPIGNAEGVALTRAEFSGDVARVSTKPVPGAIELTPEEAELFLAPALTNKLAPKPKTPPAAPTPAGGGPNTQGVNVIQGAGPTPVQSAGPPTAGPPAPAAPGRGALRGSSTVPVGPGPEMHKGQQETMELEGLRNARGPMQREARRMEALADTVKLGGALGAGAAGAADGDSGAMGASAVGLALALKKRGISKVYAVPRRYDAQQHEVRIGQLQDLTKDPKAPNAREAKERYAAALRDRQQRPMNGQPGAWSAMQDAASKQFKDLDDKLALAEADAKRKGSAKKDAPGGTAAKRLVRYSQQRPGELPLKKEIGAAGAQAGVTQDLRDLRLLDPLQQLRQGMVPRRSTPGGKTGLIGAAADQAALRLLYPGMRSAGSDASHLRGGLLGTKALQLRKDKEEEAKP
jgi:hypothetical protein